jgi:hypothetical protein
MVGLMQELVEDFHVVELSGRASIGTKAGTKEELMIVPRDTRRKLFSS